MWKALPFLRLLVPLLVGIAAGMVRPASSVILPALNLTLLVATVVLGVWSLRRTHFAWRHLYGYAATVLLLGLGYYRASMADPRWDPQYYLHYQHVQPHHYRGVVLESKKNPRQLRSVVALQAQADSAGNWRSVRGKLLVFIRDSTATALAPGLVIAFTGRLGPIRYAHNPYAFDYGRYLRSQGVLAQIFVDSANWQRRPGLALRSLPERVRDHCLAVFARQWGPGSSTYGVGAALILGDKSGLTNELRQAYTNTGAMHVLAVSGLHVGMLALTVRWLLGLIPWLRRRIWLGIPLELCLVWVFTLSTGASGSALRAAVMFSCLLLARGFQRNPNIWNTLASSAFLLLVWHPTMAVDIGFQLSYFAVAGIVYFHPLIYRRWYTPNRVLDYLWSLTAMGFAAQLVTGPLSLFYFHQFPSYFWLSGLVAVPLSSLILIGGLVLAICEPLPFLGPVLGWILGRSIDVLNGAMDWVQNLPGAVITGIWWNAWAMLGVYLLLGLAILAAQQRRLRWVLWGLVLLLVLGCCRARTLWMAGQQRWLVCYHLRQASTLDVFWGRKVLSISDSLDAFGQSSLQPLRWQKRVTHLQTVDWGHHLRWGKEVGRIGPVLAVGEQRLLILDGEQARPPTLPAATVLLLRRNPRIYRRDLTMLRPRWIVLDGSNSGRTRRWVTRLTQEAGIPLHDTALHGAWMLPW